MAVNKLIVDSGATKAEWCLLNKGKIKTLITQGISPYFFNETKIVALLQEELLPKLVGSLSINEIHYYGTGMRNPDNRKMVRKSMQQVFKKAEIEINDDMLSAARALNGHNKGIACNLGTGSFCCFYNGKKITQQSPGIGYVLGDEGSGAYLGKKVIQYYLYKIFDKELNDKFDKKYKTNPVAILENIYRKPLANRYLASFSLFLSENRGHYMIENIIEDGLNDFFFNHLSRYKEALNFPVHFVGGVAFGFQDVLQDLCATYKLKSGKVLKSPMPGLVEYHS